MSDALTRRAPWLLLPFVAALAFGVGTCLGGRDEAPTAPPVADADQVEVWTCSMHPQIRSPEPGQCPICGMDLIPASQAGADVGPAEVRLSERARTLARVRTQAVGGGAAPAGELRLLGRVDYDETGLATVTSWVGGRIDRLLVRVTGQRVSRGQVLARLYSPEVYAAHQDLIVARRQVERMASAGEAAQRGAQAALEAARTRLALLGIPEGELATLQEAQAPTRAVPIRSPFAGTVVERVATEGTYVAAGAPLLRVADLRKVWVQLDAYEPDLARLAVGQAVELTVDALPDERLEGRVAFVDPVVDPRRRTARVRVEVDNADGRLRPGMYAEALVRADAHGESALTIPASAPLFTGRRSVVYVEVPDAEEPTYEARLVRLGSRRGDAYPVIAGLSAGERVVVEGAFALDADLQIRGGHSMMTGPDDREASPLDEVVSVPAAFRAGFAPVVAAYLALAEALAADDLDRARAAAGELLTATGAFRPESPPDAVRTWAEVSDAIRAGAGATRGAGDLEASRRAFDALSAAVLRALRAFGNPLPDPVRVAHCPMALDDHGADWAQREETLANPYFGAAMLRCGTVRETLAPPPEEPASAAAPARRGGGSAARRPARRAPSAPPAPPAPPPAPPTTDPHAHHRHGGG